MRYLGLDLGTKTLGLSISDRTNTIAVPLDTIRYKNNDELFLALDKIIQKEEITILVLGFPKNMNNTIGERAQSVLLFKEELIKRYSMEVILIDERLSTQEVEKILISADVSRGKRKKVVDKLAASIILDTYLRRINK